MRGRHVRFQIVVLKFIRLPSSHLDNAKMKEDGMEEDDIIWGQQAEDDQMLRNVNCWIIQLLLSSGTTPRSKFRMKLKFIQLI